MRRLLLILCTTLIALSANATPPPGVPLPTPPVVSADDLNTHIHAGSARPKLLLVNVWASWCGPCREEWPLLAQLAHDYEDNLDILAISADTPDDGPALAAFLDAQPDTPFPVVWWQGSRGPLEAALGDAWVSGLPTTVLFDRSGARVLTIEGALSDDALRTTLDALLNPKDTPDTP